MDDEGSRVHCAAEIKIINLQENCFCTNFDKNKKGNNEGKQIVPRERNE